MAFLALAVSVRHSSTAGETIVEQAILDGHDGALIHAKEQHERYRFFLRNCEKFPCNIEEFWHYKIISVIVTKHTPLLNKFLTSKHPSRLNSLICSELKYFITTTFYVTFKYFSINFTNENVH